jgi:BioD-like phosphotransacetylase family protein
VFDLSNAQVAKILGAKVIIVTSGGIGKPIDEVALNQALFEKEGVEIMGVIINKVIGTKVDYVSDFARKGFKRKGLELLGVIPHQDILSCPTVDSIRQELDAELLSSPNRLNALVEDVVVGAMGAQNAMTYFKRGVLLITPGDREDIILAACTGLDADRQDMMAGIILTGNLRPNPDLLKVIRGMPIPVLLAAEDSYRVASKVHDITVKTRPADANKISVIRNVVSKNVNLETILKSL